MDKRYARPPFPYPGGKRRWADRVWELFGDDCIAYSEPFFGGGSMLLLNPSPCPRETICDLSPQVVNFWRAVKHDPHAVAFHADLPTSHFELTALGRIDHQWQQEAPALLAADEGYFDARRAGVWAWGMSNSIGLDFGLRGQDRASPPGGGQGIQQQANDGMGEVPMARDNRPGAGLGANQQTGEVPTADGKSIGAHGIQQQAGIVPLARDGAHGNAGTGQGIQQQAGKVPLARDNDPGSGSGVSQQAGKVPATDPAGAGWGRGVMQTAGKVPRPARGISQQAGGVPRAHHKGMDGRGVNQASPMAGEVPQAAHNRTTGVSGVHQAGMAGKVPSAIRGDNSPKAIVQEASRMTPHGGMPFDGSRLLPWILWLHHRMRRVYCLCGDWRSALTPTYTVHNDPGKRPCAVFLDPPYKMEKQTGGKYGLADADADSTAAAAYEWAVANGGNPRFRVAFCSHEGDFPVPDGWRAETMELKGIRDQERRAKSKDQIMFSPHCLDDRQKGLF